MSSQESITDLLTTEVNHLEQFCLLLDDEQKALTGAAAERLADIAAEKTMLAGRLSQLETARDNWLLKHGYPSGRTGMASLLSSRAAGGHEKTLWEQVLTLAGKAKEINETNGKLINLLLRHNQDALAALLSNGAGSIYGPDGQARRLSGGRSFGAV